jgi:hypothetical protein
VDVPSCNNLDLENVGIVITKNEPTSKVSNGEKTSPPHFNDREMTPGGFETNSNCFSLNEMFNA